MSVDIQKRIKDDQEDVAAYLSGLTEWEGEITKKDEDLKKKAVNSIAAYPPIRGTKESEIPRMSEKEEKALIEKDLGNTAFKRGKLDVALRHYTKSLECWPGSAVVYSNRAQVYLKRKEWSEANKDATTAIKLTSSALKEQCNDDNVKAYYRRAVARSNLKLYNQAKTDLNTIIAFDPMHKEAKTELRKVEEALRKIDDELEEKKGRKKLVIEEVDDDDDEDDDDNAAKVTPTPKKGRSVVIEEVDDDSDEEDVPITIAKKQAAATPAAAKPIASKGKAVVIEEVDDDDSEEDVPVTTTKKSAPPAAKPAPTPAPTPAPKPAPAPKPKATPKPNPTPKPVAPFKPKTAAELRRGAPLMIEEVEDEEEEEEDVVPVKPKPATAAPKEAAAPPKHEPTPQPKPVAPKGKTVAIEEIDEDDDEPTPVPKKTTEGAPAWPKETAAPPVAAKPEPTVATSSDTAKTIISKTTTSLASRVPTNFFEFEEVWRELRQDDALLTPYLLKIEATAFKTLFKTSLTHDIVVDVIRCLDSNLPAKPNEDGAYHALRVLYNISQVTRFKELAMFMNKDEKALVASLFTKAEASGMATDKVKKARAKLTEFGL